MYVKCCFIAVNQCFRVRSRALVIFTGSFTVISKARKAL